jgi:hypothetical protein
MVVRVPATRRTKRGQVTLDSGEAVVCPPGAPTCTVDASVQLAAVVKHKSTTLTLAHSTLSVNPGASGEIKFTLTPDGAKRLAKAHFLEVTVALTAQAGNATPLASSRKEIVQSPPASKHKPSKHKPKHKRSKKHRPKKH